MCGSRALGARKSLSSRIRLALVLMNMVIISEARVLFFSLGVLRESWGEHHYHGAHLSNGLSCCAKPGGDIAKGRYLHLGKLKWSTGGGGFMIVTCDSD